MGSSYIHKFHLTVKIIDFYKNTRTISGRKRILASSNSWKVELFKRFTTQCSTIWSKTWLVKGRKPYSTCRYHNKIKKRIKSSKKFTFHQDAPHTQLNWSALQELIFSLQPPMPIVLFLKPWLSFCHLLEGTPSWMQQAWKKEGIKPLQWEYGV